MRIITRNRRNLSALIIGAVLILATGILIIGRLREEKLPTLSQYSYEVVNVYPHDVEAFTEGLVYDVGYLYEGTGLYGQSTLRRVELKTGKVTQEDILPSDDFGEGVTIFKDKIVQLTWLQHKGFVYDKYTLQLLRQFSYSTEGWGLACNGTHLIMSDGTASLYFLDPQTFEVVRRVQVSDVNPVTGLNELEYIKGEVYANIWHDRRIAIINPESGKVRGWIDLSHITDYDRLDPENVLNGIAYNAEDDLIYVTGKRWPQIFELRLIPLRPT